MAKRSFSTLDSRAAPAALAPYLNNVRVSILDPNGNVLASATSASSGSVVTLAGIGLPADGTYSVRIHDINFHGGQAYVYRLTLTADVRVDRAYPLGGRRGTRAALTLTGQGLPPGKGSVKDGEQVYMARCAACHGEFGESAGRWPGDRCTRIHLVAACPREAPLRRTRNGRKGRALRAAW